MLLTRIALPPLLSGPSLNIAKGFFSNQSFFDCQLPFLLPRNEENVYDNKRSQSLAFVKLCYPETEVYLIYSEVAAPLIESYVSLIQRKVAPWETTFKNIP
jgi:hypothetical protein